MEQNSEVSQYKKEIESQQGLQYPKESMIRNRKQEIF